MASEQANVFLQYVVEFIGAFIFFSVIIQTGNAIAIGVALAAVIFFGGYISGGAFNPAVSFMRVIDGQINIVEFACFVVVQLIAAFLAYQLYKSTKYLIKKTEPLV